MPLKQPAKPALLSTISGFFEPLEIFERSDFDLLPDLSVRRFFNRGKILSEFLKEEKLNLSEIQELLSFNLERLLRQKKFPKALQFLKVFEKDLPDCFINRAAVVVLCKGDFESPEEVLDFLKTFSKGSLNIKPGSCEAVELLHMFLWSSFIDDLIRNTENTVSALESFRCIAFALGVDINIYKPTLKELVRYYREDFRKPVVSAIENWMKERLSFQK
ncbi:MAG TPA: hypothetical protein P5230_01850 [Candidatus Magasanikbacteria bacterium]|nr:hypothetical protein [Candidatus Magasanikbacteria bacterium]